MAFSYSLSTKGRSSRRVALWRRLKRLGEEYASLEAELIELESGLSEATMESRLDALEKLRRRHAKVARIDFFKSPRGASVAARIAHLAQRLVSNEPAEVEVEAVDKLAFGGKVWATRPNPHVDRLASIWLIPSWQECRRDPFSAIVRGGSRVSR